MNGIKDTRNSYWRIRSGVAALLLLTLPAVLVAAEDLAGQAAHLYDNGSYEEARSLLEQLDAEGKADGPSLYRLYYCQRAAGDSTNRQTLQRARAALEAETGTGGGLDTYFYLANVYSNIGRLTDAGRIATEATAQLESGAWPEPATAIDYFRAGKLYADQQQTSRAVEWYAKAIEAMTAADGSYTAYINWAGEYLLDNALQNADYSAADRYGTLLTGSGELSFDKLDRLAVIKAKFAKYDEAAELWRRAMQQDVNRANRARYLMNLCMQAASMAQLPDIAPDGRAWNELSRADLETLLSEQSQVAGATIAEATEKLEQTKKLKKKERKSLQSRLDAAHGSFIRGAMEYAFQGYPLRETAFQAGFAPLIFHARQWQLP